MTTLAKAYRAFIIRMRQIDKEVDMTQDEFIWWWRNTGNAQLRGRYPENYCMCLVDHSKPYTLANVKCITNQQRYGEIKLHRGLKIQTPTGIFPCLEDARKALHLERKTIKKNINKGLPGWSYL